MKFRFRGLKHFIDPREAFSGALVVASAFVAGCLDSTPSNQTPNLGTTTSTGTTTPTKTYTPTTGTTDLTAQYHQAQTVKVIFNKKGFYSSTLPSAAGCPGDAKLYFDPRTDRQVPVKPDWIKNISVDITNANATNGPSRALGCGLSGLGSAPAANCASFDDLQPLDGSKSHSYLVGGFGCPAGTASCSATSLLSDVWNLSVPDSSTSVSWIQQSATLPQISGMTTAPTTPGSALPGLMWHAGGYDELHDQFYTFGGVTPSSTDITTGSYTNAVVRLSFNSDQSLASNPPPTILSPTSGRYYAGFALSSMDATLNSYFPVPAMVGANFTYGLRRDPSTKSQCLKYQTPAGFTNSCDTSYTDTKYTFSGAARPAISVNEHQDYFLLTGGMNTLGLFSKNIYIFKPHGFATDVGTSFPVNTHGDWMLMSNATGAGVSSKVMAIKDIAPGPDINSAPYIVTDVGSTRVAGDVFSGWVGRAFHRTVYDPGMNRFYTFGGLENHGAQAGAPVSATGTTPDLSTSDVWIYDPPSLGRRPTSACFTNESPTGTSLPDSSPFGAAKNLDSIKNYTGTNFVFPPGGCLQRIKLDGAMPTGRFEHAMVFDRDSKAMFVFGGCKTPYTVTANNLLGSAAGSTGSPLGGCNGQALLNDLWMYIPPTVTEPMPKTWTTTATSPFNASTLLSNVFGTDFWLDHLPTYSSSNTPSAGALTQPASYQVLGTWISLSPATSPTPRASASLVYDRSHHKLYLQGGFGCADSNCSSPPRALNDLWVYTPPNIETDCDPSGTSPHCGTGGTSGQGTWELIRADNSASNTTQPSQRFGALAAHANPMVAYGDEFYTITDAACQFQGPIATADAMLNKQYVGAVYIDLDRNQMSQTSNLLINLRFMPYDKKTKAPGYTDGGTLSPIDDTDQYAAADTAIMRVQLMSNSMSTTEQIQASIQPRYHEFLSGTPVLADTLTYIAGPTGQVTERQIHIPLSIDSTINLIKIERVQGSMKLFEMTVTTF